MPGKPLAAVAGAFCLSRVKILVIAALLLRLERLDVQHVIIWGLECGAADVSTQPCTPRPLITSHLYILHYDSRTCVVPIMASSRFFISWPTHSRLLYCVTLIIRSDVPRTSVTSFVNDGELITAEEVERD